MLFINVSIPLFTYTILPAQNYTALRITHLTQPISEPVGILIANPPSPIREIADAEVIADGKRIPYDTAVQAYCIPRTTSEFFRLQVRHPDLLDHDKEYPAALLQHAEWQLVLPSLTDLNIIESRQSVIYPNPETWQKPIPAQLGKELQSAGDFIQWKGALGGVFSSNGATELADYAMQNGIPHLAIVGKGGCFFLAPAAGQIPQEFIQSVVSELSGKNWTAAIGPLLYGHADGFGIMGQEIYIETTTMLLEDATREKLLAMEGVNNVKPVDGRVGFVLNTDPGLGFEIVDLAARIQTLPEITTAEAKYERIQTGSLLEGGEERW
jgi:hypothetical protein